MHFNSSDMQMLAWWIDSCRCEEGVLCNKFVVPFTPLQDSFQIPDDLMSRSLFSLTHHVHVRKSSCAAAKSIEKLGKSENRLIGAG